MLESVEIILDEWDYPLKVTLNGVDLPDVDSCESSPTGDIGCCKTVFVSDDYVVKFGSRSEAEFLPEERHRKHFALVVYADINRKWYVQERVNCVPNAAFTRDDCKLINNLTRYYDIGDVGCSFCEPDYSDNHCHNWIKDINDVPVIYDYSSD